MSASGDSTSRAGPFARPLGGLAEAARGYRLRTLRADLLAGLTVAVVEIPQAMAYALIAGVPPQYGIYTSIVQGLVGAVFSSNPHLATGPTNTQSLLIAAIVTQVAAPQSPPEVYLSLVFALALLKGLIQLLFAAAHMGNLVRYVSGSVILGFTAGAGVLIAAGQVPAFLGISTESSSPLPGLIGTVHTWLPHLGETNPTSVMLGAAALLLVVGARAISPLVPGPLLAIAVPAAVAWMLGLHEGLLAMVPAVPEGLPTFVNPWPGAASAEALLTGAFALALLGMIETVSIGKAMTARTGGRIDPDREFLTQGLANALGAFLQNIPGSGSFTRSALSHHAGGLTRFTLVFNALFVAVIFLLFADAASRIPLTCLAAILFVVAWNLVDLRAIRRTFRASRGDALVCGITFLAALLLPLAWAIYVGIFLNLALYLRAASRLHMAEMVRTPGGPFVERPIRERGGRDQRVMFVQLEGDLFFGVADELEDRLNAFARGELRVVILRLKRTHSIDATVEAVLDRFARAMHRRGAHVLLCGVKPELMTGLRNYGLLALLGRENVFEAGYGVFTSAKAALRRARELVGGSLDADGIGMLDETEEWAYEI